MTRKSHPAKVSYILPKNRKKNNLSSKSICLSRTREPKTIGTTTTTTTTARSECYTTTTAGTAGLSSKAIYRQRGYYSIAYRDTRFYLFSFSLGVLLFSFLSYFSLALSLLCLFFCLFTFLFITELASTLLSLLTQDTQDTKDGAVRPVVKSLSGRNFSSILFLNSFLLTVVEILVVLHTCIFITKPLPTKCKSSIYKCRKISIQLVTIRVIPMVPLSQLAYWLGSERRVDMHQWS